MKRLFPVLFLFIIALAITAIADNNVWVATPTQMTQTSGGDLVLGSSAPTAVTVASTSVTNLCSSLPNEDYQYIVIQCSSGTAYINGTVATPTLGMSITTTNAPLIVPLPVLPKSRGRINCVSADANVTVKVSGLKVR